MSDIFGTAYSNAYDHFYSSKDYGQECDLIESQIARILGPGPRKLLDLGCGTGNHAIPLARRGHDVTGIDRSCAMLAQAREKSSLFKLQIDFVESDIAQLDLGQTFDAAVMMFAVLGYQTTNAAALAALAATRRHVRKGGAFLFDVWFGPAVLEQRPEKRFRTIPTPQGEILRAVSATLDQARQICAVDYELWTIEADQVTARSAESHSMRYFFPLELELLLSQTGFRLLHLGQFEAPEREPDASSWSIVGLAEAM